MNILYGLALSAHMGFEGEYNSIHPHVRLEQGPYAVGSYINSERNLSSYVSYSLEKDHYYLEFGLASGYSYSNVVPLFRTGISKDSIDMFVTLGFENGSTTPKIILGIEILLGK